MLMKKVYLAFAAVLAVSVFVFAGCNKDSISCEEETDSMYLEMLSYAEAYSLAVNNQLLSAPTKSDNGSSLFDQSSAPDISCVDEKYLKYIEIYTHPENVNNWDEHSILKQVDSDPLFSPEEKDIFIKGIAAAYYLKTEFSDVITPTKANAEVCEKQFAQAMKRATRYAALELIAAALEPTLIGETIVVVAYYCAIDDAQVDYNLCMAQ